MYSIHVLMISGIQYFLNNEKTWNVSLFNDSEFLDSRKSLDAQMKESARMGLVTPRKKAQIITHEMENEL